MSYPLKLKLYLLQFWLYLKNKQVFGFIWSIDIPTPLSLSLLSLIPLLLPGSQGILHYLWPSISSRQQEHLPFHRVDRI